MDSGRRWKLGLANLLVMGGAIFASSENGALAQLVPDDTLGEDSTVTSTGAVDFVNGGAARGANLFHSFREFNVGEGRAAYFNNPTGIENILTRVTGANSSNILGTLGVLGGNANLFLINPNGIIFGPNARLDVGGSFVGTTANAVGLSNGDVFSTHSSQPLPSNLLNVNPNAFFFNQIAAQPVINRSTAAGTGLEVSQGRSLLLIGGDVRLEGGRLFAPGGRVELAGVANSGSVGLSTSGSDLHLSFPVEVQRANVSLTNAARVVVIAGGGGNIAVNAQNLEVLEGSTLLAGIGRGLGSVGSQAGDIELNATEAITIAASGISNLVRVEAVGQGGNINIQARSLALTEGSVLAAFTAGRGNAGSVNIDARDTVSFDGVGNNEFSNSAFINIAPSGVFSVVNTGAEGKGGDINITTRSLSVTNGAVLEASTSGQGDAGSVNILARDTVSFDGIAAFSDVASGAEGKGGDINITTGSLSVTNGAQLQASTSGQGDAGNVHIFARDTVSFDGVDSQGYSSAAFSDVASGAEGKGGDINITTGSLSVTNGAGLEAGTNGQGNAGNVNIFARDTVSFDEEGSNGSPSAAYSQVRSEGVGNGGEVNITTGALYVSNGAGLTVGTGGKGNAGSLNITAREIVSFNGVSSNGLSSVALSGVDFKAEGKGGDINITTGSLSLTDGAYLNARTAGQGDAGNVNITARDAISLDGVGRDGLSTAVLSGVSARAGGKGGNIKIRAGSLSATSGALVLASSEGSGTTAGNIEVEASSIRLDNQAAIRSDTIAGQGNIFLRSEDLVLRRGSNITTNAAGTATGGNITVDTGVLVALENSDISANAEEAFGGRVSIDAQGIFGTQFREAETLESDITATSGLGSQFSGSVELNTPDVDLNSGLVNLPAIPVATEVAQVCTPGSGQANSEFIITGRGGLPPNPGEALNTNAVMVDLITLNSEVERPSTTAVLTNSTSRTPDRITEAQGWAIDALGNVILIANAATGTPHSSWQKTDDCRALNQ